MKCTILTVGTEILFGQIINTNTVYLSRELNAMGIDVLYHYTVGDNPKRLEALIKQAFHDCDLILATGGLGPTQDDLTKETACKALHDTIVIHEPSMKRLKAHFENRNLPMPENNRKQAYFPSRGLIFENDNGTAPGFSLEENDKIFISMPGPPNEMKPMFQNYVKPYLEKKSDACLYFRTLRTYGIGESALEIALLPLIDKQTDPTLATYAKDGEATVRIASKRATKEEAETAVLEMIERTKPYIGNYIYSTEDEELYQVVGKKLIEKGITLSSAESCTGGMFAMTMTNLPGISQVFDRGIVTYSNRAKIEELGVSKDTLTRYGAVSSQTAKEMAIGLKAVSGSDICISVTGIAGPEGGTEEKPVGLIYVGLIYKGEAVSYEIRTHRKDRQKNRNYALLFMLNKINQIIK